MVATTCGRCARRSRYAAHCVTCYSTTGTTPRNGATQFTPYLPLQTRRVRGAGSTAGVSPPPHRALPMSVKWPSLGPGCCRSAGVAMGSSIPRKSLGGKRDRALRAARERTRVATNCVAPALRGRKSGERHPRRHRPEEHRTDVQVGNRESVTQQIRAPLQGRFQHPRSSCSSTPTTPPGVTPDRQRSARDLVRP